MTHPSPLVEGPYIYMCNLQFTDDKDLIGGSSGELQDLTNRLVDRVTAYMEMNGSQHRKEQDHD